TRATDEDGTATMGFKFRRRIKIAPGVRVNVSRKGMTSVSLGKPGATANLNTKRVKTTVGIPGSGLSYEISSPISTGRENATSASGASWGSGCLLAILGLAAIFVAAKVYDAFSTPYPSPRA